MKTIVSLLILSIFLNISLLSQTECNHQANYIEVTGSAEMKVTPNIVVLKIILTEKQGKNYRSIVDSENILKNIIKKYKIPEKNLSISDFSSRYVDIWYKSKDDISNQKKFTLLINDINILQDLFTDFENNHISNISIIRTDHTDIIKFREETKINALKAAKEKAKYLLQSIDHEAGKLIYAQELTDKKIKNKYNRATSSNSISYSNNVQVINSYPLTYLEKISLRFEFIARFEIK